MKEIEQQLSSTAMESCLQNRQSFQAYKRQRDHACFESPSSKHARYASGEMKEKSHSPSQQAWDTESVLAEARAWPDSKKMNWTAFARKHNIPGKNAGQVVKEFCSKNDIDVLHLERRTTPSLRMRPRRLKFSNGVSFPLQKSISEIKKRHQ